jgi:hypothetical protein
MPANNSCPVDGCNATARPGQLMCWNHWKGLPIRTQSNVNATWRNVRRDPDAYRVARDKALDYYRNGGNGHPAQGDLL